MTGEISYEEFLKDIQRQKAGRKIRKRGKAPWELHSDALSRSEYDSLTKWGRFRLKRPRPVWLPRRNRWTVGAPVNPIEWQILLHSEPMRAQREKRVRRSGVAGVLRRTIESPLRVTSETFHKCVCHLWEKDLLDCRWGHRHSEIVEKWLHPDLTGQRAGGEWHRKSIHKYIDMANLEFGCFTYADRGLYPRVKMPDVITIRPRLVEHRVNGERLKEPLEWNFENPVYVEFKSAQEMNNHPERLEKQLDDYDGVPLYLEVETKFSKAQAMLRERGRRNVPLHTLLKEAKGEMVYLHGPIEYWQRIQSFRQLIEQIKNAFQETYDYKARLKKTGTDPRGRECHDLVLYDSSNTPKNMGQVIPDYAGTILDFSSKFFDKQHLGRITTADYIYTPNRKPTFENKTWKWKKKKTKGAKFRSFSA